MMEGYQELERYINNESSLRLAEKQLELDREYLYSLTYPQYDNSLGVIEYFSLRIDQAVADVSELEYYHQKNFKEHYKTRKLLNEALQRLTEEELDAYNHIVWGSPTNIDESRLKELDQSMLVKLCDFFAQREMAV